MVEFHPCGRRDDKKPEELLGFWRTLRGIDSLGFKLWKVWNNPVCRFQSRKLKGVSHYGCHNAHYINIKYLQWTPYTCSRRSITIHLLLYNSIVINCSSYEWGPNAHNTSERISQTPNAFQINVYYILFIIIIFSYILLSEFWRIDKLLFLYALQLTYLLGFNRGSRVRPAVTVMGWRRDTY